jgi:hypothetical protein
LVTRTPKGAEAAVAVGDMADRESGGSPPHSSMGRVSSFCATAVCPLTDYPVKNSAAMHVITAAACLQCMPSMSEQYF